MSSLRSSLIRLAHQRPHLRPHLLPILKSAGITKELLQVRYLNLGDFGGTDPVEDSWVLEVSGPTFDYRDELKRLGFRWNSAIKVWSIHATLYKYGGRRNAEFYKNRKLQEAAFPVVKALAQKHNEAAEAYNKSLLPPRGDLRDYVERSLRKDRMISRLEEAGIKIDVIAPDPYLGIKGNVRVKGNTYPFAAIMKRHKWRWNPSVRAWEMSGDDYRVIREKWMGDLVREISVSDNP